MKGAAIPYSDAELAWIEAHHDLPRRDLHAQFVAHFGRTDVSQQNLTALCKRKGWLTGRTGQFVRGQPSHNKGKTGFRPAGSEKGWFRKGRRAPNTLPLWSERIGKDGYIEMKVPLRNPYTGHETRFMHKHRYLWEQANGPLPEGHALKCLDGDKTNTDPENWIAVPRALLPRLNGRSGRDYDSAPPELKPLILKIAQLEHATREKRKAAQ
jgi:hypothetical protein